MIKTVSLTADTETKVEISGGYNVGVINRTTGMLYASRKSGVSAGADDVAAIPAGDSYVIRAADDTVYLLATAAGDVQLESIGAKEVFNRAATRTSSGGGEGGTVDGVARQAIETHANNKEIHVTAEEREAWNGKTTLAESAEVFSNPNLLINPDFEINQRGQTEYVNGEFAQYTVDGWVLREWNTTATVSETGLIISANNDGVPGICIEQYLPEGQIMYGEPYTLSVKSNDVIYVATGIINSVSDKIAYRKNNLYFQLVYDTSKSAWCVRLLEEAANSLALKWAQLEPGTIPTRHVKSNEALELVKCQRNYEVLMDANVDKALRGNVIRGINRYGFDIPFKVSKRIPPSLAIDSVRLVVEDLSNGSVTKIWNATPTVYAVDTNSIGISGDFPSDITLTADSVITLDTLGCSALAVSAEPS